MCGIVIECDYDGMKAALKVGRPYYSLYVQGDYFTLVKNEIEICDMLEELQRRAMPRMMVVGVERFYNPAVMVLVREKVGMDVEVRDNYGIYMCGKKLTRVDLLVLREKGLEELGLMNEHGVVHMDTALNNTHVEMKNGKVEQVWWIDLGLERIIDHETERTIDKTGRQFHMDYLQSIEWDFLKFTGTLDYYLTLLESVG